MEWDKGYSSSYYMTEIDPYTWADIERFEIKGGSINRSLDSLRQSAEINCNDYPRDKERWVRIYMDVKQLGSGAHEPLFTGLATSPDKNIMGSWSENAVACYSVLKPADDVRLTRGYYSPAGISSITILKELLSPVPAPIEFETGAPSLQESIVAESGETNFTMIERILSAISWNMRIKGDGTIRFEPYSATPVATFDPLEFDVIENQLKVSSDWFSCPNVYMATANGVTAIARDNDPNSPLSIQNRGREVWFYESGIVLQADETIGEYAQRRLSEEQEYITTVTYDRRFVPDVLPGDMVRMRYPNQGIDGDFMVTNQTIELGYSARTSEEISGVL